MSFSLKTPQTPDGAKMGFELLADDKLTTEEWKKFRALAKEKIDVITDRALADFRLRMERNGRP